MIVNRSSTYVLFIAIFFVWYHSAFAVEETRAEYFESKKSEFFVQAAQTKIVLGDNVLVSNSYRPAFDYYLYRSVSVELGYFSMSSPEDGSTLLSGFDFGGKWYPFSAAAETTSRVDGVSMESWSRWATYVLLSYRSRTLNQMSKQTGYNGYGAGAGVNFRLPMIQFIPIQNRLFVNAEVTRDTLSSVVNTRLNVTNMSLGLGSVF